MPGEQPHWFEDLIKSAANLFGDVVLAAQDNRAKCKTDLGLLLFAHNLAFGTIAHAVGRTQEIPGLSNDKLSKLINFGANFILGVNLVEMAIVEGYYLQAGTLIRQEMELIARIEEIKKDKPPREKCPDLKLLGPSKALYGQLCEYTHISNPDWTRTFCHAKSPFNGINPSSVNPTYNQGFAKDLYRQHIFWICMFGFRLDDILRDLYSEGLTQIEKDGIAQAMCILEKDIGS